MRTMSEPENKELETGALLKEEAVGNGTTGDLATSIKEYV